MPRLQQQEEWDTGSNAAWNETGGGESPALDFQQPSSQPQQQPIAPLAPRQSVAPTAPPKHIQQEPSSRSQVNYGYTQQQRQQHQGNAVPQDISAPYGAIPLQQPTEQLVAEADDDDAMLGMLADLGLTGDAPCSPLIRPPPSHHTL